MATRNVSFFALLGGAATGLFLATAPVWAAETIGGGTVSTPAVGPKPSFGIGGPGMILVKNWHFGTGGTIKNYADMSANFMYHDQFGTIGNGTNYGAVMVSPDTANALDKQPIEGVDCPPVRRFTQDSLITSLVPLKGATTVDPKLHNAGNGSFTAKWKLPNGGSLLGRSIVWETRVRYNTPPYFWFAIWTAGNKWKWDNGAKGAESDLVESFGYDNGGGNTNYDGHYWHSNSVAKPARDTVNYDDWNRGMTAHGVPSYDATQYHTWTWQYNKDNSYAMYVDGILIQRGSDYHWTFGSEAGDEPIDMTFLFDAGWGHTQVGSVNHPLPASAFDGKFYEWNYSRVYLSGDNAPAETPYKPHAVPGTVQAEDYDTGGQSVAYYYRPDKGKINMYRKADLVGIEKCSDTGGGYDVIGANTDQYLKYTVNAVKAGNYQVSFRVASITTGGKFHLQDDMGRDVSGSVAVPSTTDGKGWSTVTAAVPLKAGSQTLTLVQDTPGFNLNWMHFDAP